MKRRYIFILLILLPAMTLTAFDSIWGARLDLNLELPEIYGSSFGVSTENRAGAWFRGSWSPQANMEFDGGLKFNGTAVMGFDTGLNFSFHGFLYDIYPELDKLNFYGTDGILQYKAGRQIVSGPSGLVFSAPFDGADVGVNLEGHLLTAGFGYTGLTFRESAEYFLTQTDTERDSVLSAPRIMSYLSWEKTGVTPWLNAAASFTSVIDVTSAADQADYGNERFSPIYLELTADGFAGSSFLYEVSLVGQYGAYGDATVLAGMGRLGLSWLPGGKSRLGLDMMASSGDDYNRSGYLLGTETESSLSQYLPVNSVSTQGYVVEFEVGNLIALGAFYALRPTETFSWELRATTIMRSAIGPMSSGLVQDNGSTSHFVGQEGLMSLLWRPSSNFGWDMKLGVLYPGEPIVLDSEIEPYFPILFRMGFDFFWRF